MGSIRPGGEVRGEGLGISSLHLGCHYLDMFYELLCSGSLVRCPLIVWFDSGFLFLRQSTEPSWIFSAHSSGTCYAGFAGVRGRGRGGKRSFLAPLHIPLLAALVVDCGSGTLAMLVFLVTFFFALCSLWSSPGLRCLASWPVWIRMTVTWCVLFKVVDIPVVVQRSIPMF